MFSDTLRNAFNNPDSFSDMEINFRTSNCVLKTHRFVLALASDYFSAIIRSTYIDQKKFKLDIDTEDEILFTNLIKSIYTGDIDVPDVASVIPMLNMAAKYQLKQQELILAEYLVQNITKENVFQCLALDSERDLYKDVFAKVKKIMSECSRDLLKGDAILDLDHTQFVVVIDAIVSNDVSDVVHDTLEKWIAYDEKKRISYTYELLKLVNSRRRDVKKLLRFDSIRLLLRFDSTNGIKSVKLSEDNTVATHVVSSGSGGQVFLNRKLDANQVWRVKVVKGNFVAVGVANRDVIIEKNITWCGNENQYAYVIFKDGNEYRHGDIPNCGNTALKINQGDALELSYDHTKHTVKITSSTGRTYTMTDIPEGVYPFFYLGSEAVISLDFGPDDIQPRDDATESDIDCLSSDQNSES
jgi:hypothetical protein